MPYRISGPTHQPLRPTATAPRLTVAQNVMIHSGQFAARIATRSPGPTPYRSRSAAATEATSRSCSRNVMRRSVTPSLNTRYSLSPWPTDPARASRSEVSRFAMACMGSPRTVTSSSANTPPGASSSASILASPSGTPIASTRPPRSSAAATGRDTVGAGYRRRSDGPGRPCVAGAGGFAGNGPES